MDGKPMAARIAERFALEVVDSLAYDLTGCASKGMSDAAAYQAVYPKYASKCSDAFLRGAVKRVYAAAKPGRWTESNTELKTWFERDRASVVLEDKASGNSIMEWWDEAVKEAQDDGFLGSDSRKWHMEAVDYANEHGLKPQSSDKWHKAFQDDEKYRRDERNRDESEGFMSDMAYKVGIKNPKVDVNTHVGKASVAVGGLGKDVVEKLLDAMEEADVIGKEERIPIWVDNSKQVNQVVSADINDIVQRRR